MSCDSCPQGYDKLDYTIGSGTSSVTASKCCITGYTLNADNECTAPASSCGQSEFEDSAKACHSCTDTSNTAFTIPPNCGSCDLVNNKVQCTSCSSNSLDINGAG